MSDAPNIVWFQHDLRLSDQPALAAAARDGAPIVPVFILDEEGDWPPGGASRWWLHHSLAALAAAFSKRGMSLILQKGDASKILPRLARETRAAGVFWTRRFEPEALARQRSVVTSLQEERIAWQEFVGSLLFDPQDIATKNGDPYRVFTPFWNNCRSRKPPRAPLPIPSNLEGTSTSPTSLALKELDLAPRIAWDEGLNEVWRPGEQGAQLRLREICERLNDYSVARNRPAQEGTSRLSPHLHFGEISPHQVWQTVRQASKSDSAGTYLNELGWREFAHHVLFHFPRTTDEPLRDDFAKFPWSRSRSALTAWQKGLTGYPIVDAGMRQLWRTGWMHNRVRMIVGSFLTKDLLISWQQGARWFWDTLVDADLANNSLNWQWVAGCGADAAPFFRIFNPVTQGKKFDPEGAYVREWVPEIAALPDRWIHAPWTTPATELAKTGIELGVTYPLPMVDHAESRQAALDVFRARAT